MNNSTLTLWEEEKQEPQIPSELTPEGALNYTIIETETRSVKTEWIVIGNQKMRIRRCPECKKILIYKSKRGYFNGKQKSRKCRHCSALNLVKIGKCNLPHRIGIKLSEEHRKKISIAGIERHKKYTHPMLGKKQTQKCIDLAKKRYAGKGNPMYGKHHSEETRRKISETRKAKKISGPKMTEDGLRRLRQKRIKEIEIDKFFGNQVIPSFNKKSCIFFDKLEKEFGWNGYYATKNGEYHIKELGYFLDYYEPIKNVVIEWDERQHYNIDGTLKEKDIVRQKQIEEFLRCKIIRIREKYFDEQKSLQEIKNI